MNERHAWWFRRAQWLRRDNSGAGALEFALTIIVAIPLLVGLIEVGRALHSRNALEYLADTSARSVLVELRHAELTPAEMEERLLDDARARWTGTAPARLSLAVEDRNGSLRITLEYGFDYLIPLVPLDPITLRAVRSVPAAG